MQTLTEQLVEALQDTAAVLRCMSVNSLARREFREGALKTLNGAYAALDRARAEPEALLRENGEAVRRTGNELMQGARDRQWAMTRERHGPLGFPDLSCCWSSRKGTG